MPVTITGGSLKFSQRVKTGDFEWKEATADFSFSSSEGENASEAETDAVADRACNQVGKMLKTTMKYTPGRPKVPTPAKQDVQDKVAPPVEVAEVDEDVITEDVSEAALPDVLDKDMHEKVAAKVQAFTEAKREGGPKLVKDLIYKFAIPPQPGGKGSLGTIPQAKRREFLVKLAELVA